MEKKNNIININKIFKLLIFFFKKKYNWIFQKLIKLDKKK